MTKAGRVYAVVFATFLAGGCSLTILGNAIPSRHVAALKDLEKRRAILQCFGLVDAAATNPHEADVLFSERITVTHRNSLEVYNAHDERGKPLGVAFEVNAKGYNGPIFGIMALEPDRRTIRDLRFYRQTEPPEHGGKIATRQFAGLFIGQGIVGPDGMQGFAVGWREANPRVIDAITGASKTTRNVVDAVNEQIAALLAGGSKLEPIEIPVPPYAGEDPPIDLAIRNLLIPAGVPRRPLMAPQGTTNIGLDRPVTSSDDAPVAGHLEQITDGVKDAGEGNFVELHSGPQWIQIDLGRTSEIFAVAFWHEHARPTVYFDVIVQTADDAEFTRNVRTIFNNDDDNSAGRGAGSDMHYFDTSEGKLVVPGLHTARYVRLYSNNNHAANVNRYTEVEVYGRARER